jgi:hypothetical protein
MVGGTLAHMTAVDPGHIHCTSLVVLGPTAVTAANELGDLELEVVLRVELEDTVEPLNDVSTMNKVLSIRAFRATRVPLL